jgi:ferredoxin
VVIRRGTLGARLRLDPVACDGFGYCAELAPELIVLDEWGYPMVDNAPVPPGLVDVVAQAVERCPRRALFLEQPVDAPCRRVSRR